LTVAASHSATAVRIPGTHNDADPLAWLADVLAHGERVIAGTHSEVQQP
jgi:hypothetical protein